MMMRLPRLLRRCDKKRSNIDQSKIVRVTKSSFVTKAILTTYTIDTDIVIIGAGVKPNSEIAVSPALHQQFSLTRSIGDGD
jgi:hypothetical protein